MVDEHYRRGGIGGSMAGDGDASSPDDSHGNENANDRDARKRKRPTLSCLPCKKRKTKCDKMQPCATCRGRNESVQCVYEYGSTPPPPQRFVSEEEFVDLKRRLEVVERSLARSSSTQASGISTLNTPTSIITQHLECTRAANVEKAFGALENLGVGGALPDLPQQSPSSSASASGENASWPSIVAVPGDGKYRSTRWARDMYELVQELPRQEITERLVNHYFAEIHPGWRFLHEGVFRQELALLFPILQAGAYLSIDPAWLSVLLAMICMSANELSALPESQWTVSLGLDTATLKDLARRMYCSLEIAFLCAGWLVRPQARILFSLIITMPISGRSNCIAAFDGLDLDVDVGLWGDIAIWICKALRFHRLPDTSPMLPDPAFPPTESTYARQIAARAFYILYFFDAFQSSGQVRSAMLKEPYLFPEGSFSTPEPLNYTDEALLSNSTAPRGWHEKTPEIWELHKIRIAKHWKKIMALLEKPAQISYELLLDVDRDLRKDHQDLVELAMNHDLSKYETVQFLMLNSSYRQRLIRLHRPFLLRSYTEDRYRYSRTVTLSTARQVLLGHRKALVEFGSNPMVLNALYLFAHHLVALIILLAQAVLEPHVRVEVLDQVQLSADVFRLASMSKHRAFARAGEKCGRVCFAILDRLQASDQLENLEDVLRAVEQSATQGVPDRHTQPIPCTTDVSSLTFSFLGGAGGGSRSDGIKNGGGGGTAADDGRGLPTAGDTAMHFHAAADLPLWDFDWATYMLDTSPL